MLYSPFDTTRISFDIWIQKTYLWAKSKSEVYFTWRITSVRNWRKNTNIMEICLHEWWRFHIETFPRYWPSVRGIRQSSVNSPHKDQWRGALIFFFDLRLNKRLCKQWWGWWFETQSRPFWRHCNEDTSHSPWMLQISCWRTVRIQLTNYNTTSTATYISFHNIEI